MGEFNTDIQKIKSSICEAMESPQGEDSLCDQFPPILPPQPSIDKIDPQEINLNVVQAFHDLDEEALSKLDAQLAEHLHFLNTHYCTDIKKEFTSHRFILGKIVVFIKTCFRPLIRLGLSDYLEQQKAFNAVTVRYCNTIQKKLNLLSSTMKHSQELWQNQDIANQTHSLRIEQSQKYIDHLKYLTKELNYRQQLQDEKLSISRD